MMEVVIEIIGICSLENQGAENAASFQKNKLHCNCLQQNPFQN